MGQAEGTECSARRGQQRAEGADKKATKAKGKGPPHTGGGTWMLQTGQFPAQLARRRLSRGHTCPAGGRGQPAGPGGASVAPPLRTAAPRPLSAGNFCSSAVSSTETPSRRLTPDFLRHLCLGGTACPSNPAAPHGVIDSAAGLGLSVRRRGWRRGAFVLNIPRHPGVSPPPSAPPYPAE